MVFTKWEWDPHRKENFYRDYDENTYTYESGKKIPINGPSSGAQLGQNPAHGSTSSGGDPYRDRTSAGSELSVTSAFSSLSISNSSDPDSPPPRRGSVLSGSLQWRSESAAVTSSERYGQNADQEYASLSGATTDYPPSARSATGSTGYSIPTPSSTPSLDNPSRLNDPSDQASVPQPNDEQRLQQVGRNIETSETAGITQPELKAQYPKAKARMRLRGTYHTGSAEPLDPSFQIYHADYFRKGFVFKVLWPELAGDSNKNITLVTKGVGSGEKLFVKIRWFVVVREGRNSSSCLSIQTYGRKGVTDTKVKSEHAIMYTGPTPPNPLPSEVASPYLGEGPMGDPIQVIANRQWEKLDVLSRVNFRKIYTVEHNVKINPFGQVAPNDEWKLIAQFNRHWDIGPVLSPAPTYPMAPIPENTRSGHEDPRGETPRPFARSSEGYGTASTSTASWSRYAEQKLPHSSSDSRTDDLEEDSSKTPVPSGGTSNATVPWQPPRPGSRTIYGSVASPGTSNATVPWQPPKPGSRTIYGSVASPPREQRSASSAAPYSSSDTSPYGQETGLSSTPESSHHSSTATSSGSYQRNLTYNPQGQYHGYTPQSQPSYGTPSYGSQGYSPYAPTNQAPRSTHPQAPIQSPYMPSTLNPASSYAQPNQYPNDSYDSTYGATAGSQQPTSQSDRPYPPSRSASDNYPPQSQGYSSRDYSSGGRSQSYDQGRPY